MSPVYAPYIPIVVVILLGVVLGAVILLLNGVLGPNRPNPRKNAPFECGNEPSATARRRFDVKFYLVAIFFIVFDIEVVFLFPWAVRYRDALAAGNGWLYFGEMMLFLSLLTAGLAYIWKRGALQWE